MQGSLQAATRREKDVGQVFGKCGSSAGRLVAAFPIYLFDDNDIFYIYVRKGFRCGSGLLNPSPGPFRQRFGRLKLLPAVV
jgi:hypothetical protein